jgi:hypothetical protein
MNVVVAGDYQGKAVVFIDTKKGIGIVTSLFKRKEWLPLTKETVEKYEVVFDEPVKPSASRTFRLSVEFKDGKKSLIELEENLYKIMMNKCF